MVFEGHETSPTHSPAVAGKSRSEPKKEPIPTYKTVAAAANALWELLDGAYRKGRPSTVPELPSAEEAVALAKHAADYPKSVPVGLRRAVSLTALALVTLLRKQLDTVELSLANHGLAKGADKTITLAEYATVLGLNSPQSAEMRRLRLTSQATNEDGRRDERIGRRTRTEQIRTAKWLSENAIPVRAAARAVVAMADGFDPSLSDDLEEIAELLADEPDLGPVGQELVTKLIVLAGEAKAMGTESEDAARALATALDVRKKHHAAFDDPPRRKAKPKEAKSQSSP